MKLLFSILPILFFIGPVFSQDCEVMTASIKGKYTGGCKDKKADGAGKSEGTDIYEGNFKKGYPSGEGTYTYQNGDFYKGIFKKGAKDGEGEFHYKNKATGDSVVKGFWKNDEYIGAYKTAYEVSNKTPGIDRLDVRDEGSSPNNLTITSENIIKSNSMRGIPPATPVISYVNADQGGYDREERALADKKSILTLYNLKFPFHAHIVYQEQSFDILISKPGRWSIDVQIVAPSL